MSVFFTSDWHLGHEKVAKHRGFVSAEAQDQMIVDRMGCVLTKRDTLYILGDLTWTPERLGPVALLPCRTHLVLGNHDYCTLDQYLTAVDTVHGCLKYKKFWLTHIPVHPQEMYRVQGNIHGHIHKGAATQPLDWPYINVNVDFWDYQPVSLVEIREWFDKRK